MGKSRTLKMNDKEYSITNKLFGPDFKEMFKVG